MKTGFRRPSESNVQVYVDIGDPYPGRAEFIEYFDFADPALETPTIKSWGGNNYGQLGFGNTTNTSTPGVVGAGSQWRQISAGALHTAAIRYDGTLWAWGNNGYGQVGDSSLTNRSSPVQIGTRTDWQQVSCGFTHTVAITQDGNLWAWGSNIWNQLGVTSMPFIFNVLTSGSTYVVPTGWSNTNNKIECIGGGGGGGIGAGGGGGAYAANANIVLSAASIINFAIGGGGAGSTQATSPVQATAGGNTWFGGTSFSTSFVGAAGGRGAGAGGQASNSRGPVRFSGGNGGAGATGGAFGGGGGGGAGGPLGNGGNGGSFNSTRGGGGGGGNGGGANGNAAVSTTQGGRGGNGRISSSAYSNGGAGGTFSTGSAGTQGSGGGGGSGGPSGSNGQFSGGAGGNGVEITGAAGSGGGAGGAGVDSFYTFGQPSAAGGLYGGGGGGPSYSLYPGGGGAGAQGAIIVSYAASWSSSPIQVGSSNAWVQVSAGGYHTMGIQRDYTTWAWGANGFGQCGLPSPIVTVPTQLVDENANIFYSISVSAGWQQTLAVSVSNELYVWGDNTYGQLGTGDLSSRVNPSKVGSLQTWQSVSSHGVSSGGILSDGSLYVWGYNGNYNLGLGDLVNRSNPIKLGSSNWQEISMGLYHATAIRYDGSLWSWGYNANGEIGNNSSGIAGGISTPIQISSLTNWKRAVAGGNPIDVLWPLNGNVNIAAQGFTVAIAVATDF